MIDKKNIVGLVLVVILLGWLIGLGTGLFINH